ncbi:hypothetical protein [Burkholderia sp. AU16741]|uniref:hypothetical protein n=1 Tax=Burkholderia sp. AU16741 TaxID=2015347 RepID=UPI0015C5B8E4|nr:hypothetical protein [Burkholderia sp. AU16741]
MERQSVVRGDGEIRRESPYRSSKENTYAGVVADIPALVAATFGAAERYNNGSVFVAWQASPALLFETG